MPAINPKILIWARETAGLSLEEAARAVALKDTQKITGADKLAALEAGEQEPTRQLLERMAEKYRRSLLVFYLDNPPVRGDRGQDFRNLPGEKTAFDPNLDALIRDLKARQNLVKSLLEDEEASPLWFIGSAKMRVGTKDMVESIASAIGFSLEDFRSRKDASAAFNYLRRCVENSGIFVLLLGDLGSHHTSIPVETFRGFAIADRIAPFVVVNGHDSKAAMSFTILHEVAHLWLGTTGVSGTSDEMEIERFCNAVAGAILLPSEELKLLEQIQSATFISAVAQLSTFAAERNISRAMVAYNLLKVGKIDQARWQAFTTRFKQDWEDAEKEKEKEKEPGGKGGGPSYYVVQRYRLGHAILGLVDRSISAGTISPTKAGRILGVKPRNVSPLLSEPTKGGA